MSTRKRRTPARLQEYDVPSADASPNEAEPAATQQPRSKKQRSSSAGAGPSRSAAAAAAAAAAGGEGDAGDVDERAAGGDTSGARDAGPSSSGQRMRQPRTECSQQEIDTMMAKIKEIEKEGDEAADKAAQLDVAAASVDAAVSQVVRFLLFRHHEKPGVPVKRQDMVEVITAAANLKNSRGAKKLPSLVLPMAAAKLATAFGLELRELRRPTAGEGGAAAAAAAAAGGSAAAAAAGAQTYKLLSLLPVELLTRYAQPLTHNAERAFITLVLALIQLNQYKMDADELWRHLANLGVDKDDSDAGASFGKHPMKLLEGMEHNRYLISSKQAAPTSEHGMLTVYEWGEAAYAEFGGTLLEGVVDQLLHADQTS